MRYATLTALKKEIDRKRVKLQAIRAAAETPTAAHVERSGKRSGHGDRTGKAAADIADLETELQRLQDEYNAAVDSLQPERDFSACLIKLHVVHGLTWADIADKLNMTEAAAKKACSRYKW